MDPSSHPGINPAARFVGDLGERAHSENTYRAMEARRALDASPAGLGGAMLGGTGLAIEPVPEPTDTVTATTVRFHAGSRIIGPGVHADAAVSSSEPPEAPRTPAVKFSGSHRSGKSAGLPATPMVPGVSRVIHNPGIRSSDSTHAITDTVTDIKLPAASTPTELDLSPEEKEAAIQDRLKYLSSISELRKLGRSGLDNWSSLLGGDIAAVSERLKVQVDSKKALDAAGARHDLHAIGFGAILDTGHVDPVRDNPTGAYKFYHSFKNKELGEAYVTEVIRRAWDAKITLGAKSFDHDYDGINFYTSHFRELEAIIKDVYPKFKGAFGDTEHFLQGEVEGVDARHIGWVQETRNNDLSHSERMRIIGKALDNGGLNIDSYLKGCEEAGVRPEAPWLFNDALTKKVETKAAVRQAEIDRIRAERAKATR